MYFISQDGESVVNAENIESIFIDGDVVIAQCTNKRVVLHVGAQSREIFESICKMLSEEDKVIKCQH